LSFSKAAEPRKIWVQQRQNSVFRSNIFKEGISPDSNKGDCIKGHVPPINFAELRSLHACIEINEHVYWKWWCIWMRGLVQADDILTLNQVLNIQLSHISHVNKIPKIIWRNWEI
jgi:hypothetical protein